MNKGTIEKNYKNELVVSYDYIENGKYKCEDYSLHPQYRYYNGFITGQQVNFIQAMECDRHYPEHCDCYTKKIYAIVVPDKKKKNWIKRLLSKFKRR
jgi:hypothetical protein